MFVVVAVSIVVHLEESHLLANDAVLVAMLLVLVVHFVDSHLALRDAINPGVEVPRQLALDMSPKQASVKQQTMVVKVP